MGYKCILADPPWGFRDKGSRIAPEQGHYKTLSLAEVVGMAPVVKPLAETNSHLWLCAPNAFVIDGSAQLVALHWGFKPKQLLTWTKGRQIGMGHWLRNSTEQIILCVSGRLGPSAKNVPTHFDAPRGKHSAKPKKLYEVIEAVSPGPRIELFARSGREGWDCWGNEAPDKGYVDIYNFKSCKQ